MTDGSEAVVWDAVYNPFGDVNAITGSAANNLRFPGQYFLIEAGLHYNWHRHYDPTLGRYTQTDPLGFVDGPSIYGYAESSTLLNTDPTGLEYVEFRFQGSAMGNPFRIPGEGVGGGGGFYSRPGGINPSGQACYIGDTKLSDLYFYRSLKLGPGATGGNPDVIARTGAEKAFEFLRLLAKFFDPRHW